MSHKIGGRTRLLFVFGDPIGHSLSPFMHNRALETLGADLAYLPLHVPPQRIRTAVDLLRIILLGKGHFPVWTDLGVIGLFCLATTAVGVTAFGRLQQEK